jgi:hypothetical protein
MNNMYGTPTGGYDSDPAGENDTFQAAAAAPDRKRRRLRWGAGITLAGFLAGGAIALAVVTGGGVAAAGSASGPGAELNSVLSTAASSGPAATPAKVRWALGRLRRLGGVDGTVTFHNKKGFHTLSFERGTIQSVSSSDVVIKASDGTTWSWQIVSDTVVRKNGSKTTVSALSAGETVFAGGPVVNGAKDARLIVIGKSQPTGSSSPAGSSSAQTSLS